MRKLILAMRTSLNGFAAGPDDDPSWMPPNTGEQWEGLFELLSHVDLLLLGGGMWEGYHWYWSQALSDFGFDDNDVRYAKYAERTEHVIFSSSIKEVDWPGARIKTGGAVQAITALKQQPGGDIQFAGGYG